MLLNSSDGGKILNRSNYFNYIEEKLNIVSERIKSRGKLNILDLNIHSESFYSHFLNKLFSWELTNQNTIRQNNEAIDLIDHRNKLVVQVSATSTKAKIDSALKKEIIQRYNTYTFKFISIAVDSKDLRSKMYLNPHSIKFCPNTDIIDKNAILSYIVNLDILKQKEIFDFIKEELGNETDIVKFDSNIAQIINILSKEEFNINAQSNINAFEIERKIQFNNLKITRRIIDNYIIYHSRVDKKYNEFDKLGINKSDSVLQLMQKQYIQLLIDKGSLSADEVFLYIIERIKNLVISSKNYIELPLDELDLCISILIVDAFVRCKIFENPEEYNYAITK
jgi:hypothetical protein